MPNPTFKTRPCQEVLDDVTSQLFAARAERDRLLALVQNISHLPPKAVHWTNVDIQDLIELADELESRQK